jgi:hypothetical protein
LRRASDDRRDCRPGQPLGVELPIATQMAEVLSGRMDVRSAVETLMLRRQRAEADGDREAGNGAMVRLVIQWKVS